ncbi:hypothetical protein K2173_015008 [Erythroxylum novogranatense]|uniref:Uncharacterized protein n=1 Tax=Erythroxylum novogranatense TaxID=1862640 RepID=A0AAV8TWI0_9ROSI|nr:hypothetical protein K2173_015008 [Erythroxylum novogranatense]
MEQNLGEDSVPVPESVDKSSILDVKPLRSLVPVFPLSSNFNGGSGPQGFSPFLCFPPSGPFPPGYAPFYPFAGIQTQPAGETPIRSTTFYGGTPISTAVPLNSYQTPEYADATKRQSRGSANGDKDVGSKTKSQKRTRGSQDVNFTSSEIDHDAIADDILTSYDVTTFDTFRRSDGDKEAVEYTLGIFELLRRKIMQVEDLKESTFGQIRRSDLRAATILMNKGFRTNAKKRIGAVPGVEVGAIFFFRMEMCLIGLHSPSMAGIDYMSLKVSQEEEPLAVSIVSSGGYEDNVEDENVLIYSGHGGNINRKDKEIMDQKLERGNLALEKSLHRGNEVRVVRGLRDPTSTSPAGKVYVYDGLYKIQESWIEKGLSGCSVFKYKLIRVAGQPDAFKIWKSIQLWREGVVPRSGIILPDLTSGREKLPVSLINDVDNEKGPAYFTYSSSLQLSKESTPPLTPAESFIGCTCSSGCLPGKQNCPCVQKNGGYLPHTANAVLVDPKSIIYECGSSCHCPPNCRNRVTQGGIKVRLEVFKTKDKGWALRSWDPIRAGTFICEYAGEVISSDKMQQLGSEIGDHFFDGTHIYQPVVNLPGCCSKATSDLPFPIVINAKNFGNVSRFLNHSCWPNVFWQPVMRASNKEFDLHIAFYALRHIPPMTELTYDYGVVSPEKAELGKKQCLCGSPKCRGFFY